MLFGAKKKQEFLSGLYQKYFRSLWGYAYHLCGDKDLSDDIVQTCFVKIIDHVQTLGRLDNDYKVKAYLNTVVRNTYFSIYGREKTGPQVFSYDELAELGADFQLETFIINKTYTKGLVDKLLSELTERERDLITLFYYVGLSHGEIAEAMNLSKSNVGVLLHRTIKKLRKSATIGGELVEYTNG